MSLTIKQQRFIDAYIGVANGNSAEAVILAGYDVKDRETASKIGYENLNKPEIKKAITDKRNEFASKLDVEVNHLLICLLEIAKSSDTPPGVRVKAITDLLDRAGLQARKDVSIDATVVDSTEQTKEIAKRARAMMAMTLVNENVV